MAGVPVMTDGQGFFVPGMDRTAPVMQDSTKFVGKTADILAGAPLALLGTDIGVGDERGKLHTDPANTTDTFYGVSSSNINILLGRTSLGEFESKKANAELMGRFTIRQSVFLDSNFAQTTVNPFATFPVAVDVGKLVHALNKDGAGADITDVTLTGSASKPILKWVVDGTGGGGSAEGFENVARIVALSDDGSEVELELTGAQVAFATGITP